MSNPVRRCLRALTALAVLVSPAVVAAQAPPQTALAVFLDCRSGCDSDFIRTEINYVDWVRDQTAADVHVLITSQSTGADGEAFTLAFLGLRRFAGRGDTLTYVSGPTMTSEERRRGLTRMITLGLVPYVARTPIASQFSLSRARTGGRDDDESQTRTGRDPWRAWVFEIDLSTSLSGEKLDKNTNIEGGFEANRTTEQWKTRFSADLNYDEEKTIAQEYDDDGVLVSEETFRTIQRDWSVNGLLVKSLGQRMSLGLKSSLESETFRNIQRSFELAPAIEFNFYPYSEATRRELVLQYAAGYRSFRYVDTTIFDKLQETLPVHAVALNYATRQPWGSTDVAFEHLSYLNDPSKRSTQVEGELDVRLFRGLSLRIGGNYNWIHDQLYLRKGRRDLADVLLRRQQLLTSYEYGFDFGITYTFGSIFNNVVNPRF
jgi:hypothetical protein